MALVRVTKEFSFEMAHALLNYDGPCKHIHGHSYKLFVTVIGEPNDDVDSPKNGMLIDFGDLKHIVKHEIVDVFDHAFVLNKLSQIDTTTHQMYNNTIFVDYQPTCENMVVDFSHRIKAKLPAHVTLFSARLYETATSYTEWFASDNK